jgi:hypothetical protein
VPCTQPSHAATRCIRRSKNCRPLASTPRVRMLVPIDSGVIHPVPSISPRRRRARSFEMRPSAWCCGGSLVAMVAPPEAIHAIATPAVETAAHSPAERSPSSSAAGPRPGSSSTVEGPAR